MSDTPGTCEHDARYKIIGGCVACAHNKLVDDLAAAQAEIERLQAKIDALTARPDFLSQAMNEGDGVYRP